MTILDKEKDTDTKKKKKKVVNKDKEVKKDTKKKQPIWFYKLLSFLLIIFSISMLGVVIYNELFSLKFMIPLGIFTFLIVYVIVFILNKRLLKKWVKNIFSFFAILIILLDIIMMFFGTKTLKFLSSITDTGYRVETYGVYVLKDSSIKDISSLDEKDIGILEVKD